MIPCQNIHPCITYQIIHYYYFYYYHSYPALHNPKSKLQAYKPSCFAALFLLQYHLAWRPYLYDLGTNHDRQPSYTPHRPGLIGTDTSVLAAVGRANFCNEQTSVLQNLYSTRKTNLPIVKIPGDIRRWCSLRHTIHSGVFAVQSCHVLGSVDHYRR